MPFKRRGAETGSGFQEAINRANEAYERSGRACITRKAIPGKFLVSSERNSWSTLAIPSAPPSANIRLKAEDVRQSLAPNEGWRRFVPESKAEPDYGGTVAPDGRAIFYDAKTTKRNLLDFDNLHAHQIGFLERMGRLGAIAGFLVEFSKTSEVFFLPIQVLVRWRDSISRKSLPQQFFSEYLTSATRGKGMLVFDYLAAIDEQERMYGSDYATLDLSTLSIKSRRKAG